VKESFDAAMEFLRQWEGWKSDDPADRGGRTVCGISAESHPEVVESLWNLPEEVAWTRAASWYRSRYWDALACDHIPAPMDRVIFDIAVNNGRSFAETVYRECQTPQDALLRRIGRYSRIINKDASQLKFIKGWLNRTLSLYEQIKGTEG